MLFTGHWRYFSTLVGEGTSWLPPDNYQVAHNRSLAMRTSPTNIGLWMTSVLGAHDCGYQTISQTIEKLGCTMATISRLQRHQGHLLNWYDIQTLAPLEPRYVSTVDSGNLLGALWALEQGLGELVHAPLMDGKAFAGLADTGEILKLETALQKIPYDDTLDRPWPNGMRTTLAARICSTWTRTTKPKGRSRRCSLRRISFRRSKAGPTTSCSGFPSNRRPG